MIFRALFIMAAFAVVNRIRGGGLWAHLLPGHPRFWCFPAVLGLAFWTLGDWKPALWFAAVWFAWSLQPWGDLYMMGRLAPDGKEQTNIVTCVLGLVALGLFAGAALTPIRGVAPLVVLAVALPVSYEIGWRWYEAAARRSAVGPRIVHTQIAEPLIGAAWGATLFL